MRLACLAGVLWDAYSCFHTVAAGGIQHNGITLVSPVSATHHVGKTPKRLAAASARAVAAGEQPAASPAQRAGPKIVVLTAAQLAVMAANRVESAGACPAQRLAALLQLQRHVDGLVAKAKADAGNAPARDTGD